MPYAVIYTDSLSALQALTSVSITRNPLVNKLPKKVCFASVKNMNICFFLIPSHVGIEGNEEADRAASTFSQRLVDTHILPYTDHKHILKTSLRRKWQSEWDRLEHNKLHLIKPYLREWESARQRERFYQVILCQLRIGHTRLTHSFLLRGEEPPTCDHCDTEQTIINILKNVVLSKTRI